MFCLTSSGKFVGYDFPKVYHIRNYLLASLLPMLHLPLSLLLMSSVAWAIKELLPENKSPFLMTHWPWTLTLMQVRWRILLDNNAFVGLTKVEEECCMGNCSTFTTEQYALLDFCWNQTQILTQVHWRIQRPTNATLACVPPAKYDHCMTKVTLQLQLEIQNCHESFGQRGDPDCPADV